MLSSSQTRSTRLSPGALQQKAEQETGLLVEITSVSLLSSLIMLTMLNRNRALIRGADRWEDADALWGNKEM